MNSEIESWQQAAADLDLDVVAPFEWINGGSAVMFTALIKEFGALNGMVAEPDPTKLTPWFNALIEAGYGFSVIETGSYNRESVIEVLTDWGWYGEPTRRPNWLQL